MGPQLGRGDEEIDAAGLLVTPGFVDIHTHYDGQVTWENRLVPSSAHGVTAAIMGNCGVDLAPLRHGHRLLPAARRAARLRDGAARRGPRTGDVGAMGIATSRTIFHRSSDGKPIPTLEAGDEELMALADTLRARGKGVFQIVEDLHEPGASLAHMRRIRRN